MTPLGTAPERVGLAIVGCGFIAGIHAANAAALTDVDVRVACDVRDDIAERFARDHGIARWTTDVTDVLVDDEIHAIAICTHPPARAAIAVPAAAAGKHLFLEKPMAATLEEAETIARAARASGIVVAVDFKFRAAPAVQGATAAVPAAVHVIAQAAMEPLPPESPHMDNAQGGGIVENLGSHVFDIAYALTASEPVWITCCGVSRDDRAVACDVATGVIGHASGALTSYSLGDVGLCGYASKWLLQCFHGERTATVTNHGRDLYLDTELAPALADGETPPHEVGTLASLAAFARAIRHGSEPAAGAEDGLRAMAVVAAANESMRAGGALVQVRGRERAPIAAGSTR